MKRLDSSRVLVLTSTFPRYPGDTIPPFVLRLCQALRSEGWESWVLTPHASKLAVQDVVEGISCWRFPYAPASLETLAYGGGMLANVREARWRWLLVPFYLLSLLIFSCFFLWKKRISVVHAHWIIPQGIVGVMLKRIFWWRRIHLVMTAHGGDLHANMGGVVRRLLVWTMRQADVVAVVSQAMRQHAIDLGVPEEKIVLGPMGVDTRSFCPPEQGQRRTGVLFVGRLAEKKGVSHLLTAFSLLVKRMPELHLSIIGDGPLRQMLEETASILGLQDSVTFRGGKAPEEIPAFFQRASVFVMPSIVASTGDQEGLGLVAAEAMSCACPVVAFDLPAVRDLVVNDQTGLLVAPGDDAALAREIERVLTDAALSARLTGAAKQHIDEGYSWQAGAARYRRFYEIND